MAEVVLPGSGPYSAGHLGDGATCEVCRTQSVQRRLSMEASVARSARELRQSLRKGALSPEEHSFAAEALRDARQVLTELRRHRAHTPFFKVVARGNSESQYISVYDGETSYSLG